MTLHLCNELLQDKRVVEEVNKHLWIESQKVGYSIGIERAKEEWLRLYAESWMKYNMPSKYERMKIQQKKGVKNKNLNLV